MPIDQQSMVLINAVRHTDMDILDGRASYPFPQVDEAKSPLRLQNWNTSLSSPEPVLHFGILVEVLTFDRSKHGLVG